MPGPSDRSTETRRTFVQSRAPEAPSLLSADEIADYSRHVKAVPTPERWQELRIAGGTLLSRIERMSPRDPERATWQEIARNYGIDRTPYDSVQGPAIHLMQDPELRRRVIAGYADNLMRMERLTLPSVLMARMRMVEAGAVGRPNREIDYFERMLESTTRRALSWDDIGWGIPERRSLVPGSEDFETAPNQSTTAIHAHGMWSHIGRHLNGSPRVGLAVLGCSHPDLMTPLAVAEQAIIGMDSFVPTDGPWGREEGLGLRAKKEFVRATMDLIEHHPLILTHQFRDFEIAERMTLARHLVSEAKRRVGVTLKPHPPEEAAEQAKQLHEELGVKVFRIFDPRDTPSLPVSVNKVRKAVGDDCFIYASQVTGIESAKACLEAGANAVIMNIGDGESCTTASGTGMIASNLLNFYRVQRDLDPSMGIIVDGGVGKKTGLALRLGATGSMKHGSILGGTLHQGPVLIGIHDKETGEIHWFQSGEAAKRNKARAFPQAQRRSARLTNVEGVDGHRTWNPRDGNLPGFTMLLEHNILQPLAKEIAFSGGNHLAGVMQWVDPVFWEATSSAAHRAGAHFGQS